MTVLNISGYDVMIDDEDVEKVTALAWHVNKWTVERRGLYYFEHTVCYTRDDKRAWRIVKLHRLIMGCEHGDDKIVDHIDGNTLNCQKSNMRLCSHAENTRNRKRQRNNTSGHKGVYWYKGVGKWRVKIMKDLRQIHIGYFSTLEKAIKAYEEASLLYHGEFARSGA